MDVYHSKLKKKHYCYDVFDVFAISIFSPYLSHWQTAKVYHSKGWLLPHPFDLPLRLVGNNILVGLHLLYELLHCLISKFIVIFVKGVICHHIPPTLSWKSLAMFLYDKFNHLSDTRFEFLFHLLSFSSKITLDSLLKAPAQLDSLSRGVRELQGNSLNSKNLTFT